MSKRRAQQETLFFSAQEIPQAVSHPFYCKVNEILERNKVDKRLEHLCKRFYKPVMGRPGMMPVETHKAVFRWFVKVLGEEGLMDW